MHQILKSCLHVASHFLLCKGVYGVAFSAAKICICVYLGKYAMHVFYLLFLPAFSKLFISLSVHLSIYSLNHLKVCFILASCQVSGLMNSFLSRHCVCKCAF